MCHWEGDSKNNLLILLVGLILETQALFILTTLDVKLSLFQADIQVTPFSLRDYGYFCRAGSIQQAQQSTHLAKGPNPL